MGKRGPAKTPTAILQIRGSWRGSDRKGEPKARRKAPTCPLFLAGDDLARSEWDRICGELDFMGILSAADATTLAAYCETAAEYQRLAQRVRDELAAGAEMSREFKTLMEIKNKARADLLRYAGQFGLTPSARASIEVGNKHGSGDEDEKNFAAG